MKSVRGEDWILSDNARSIMARPFTLLIIILLLLAIILIIGGSIWLNRPKIYEGPPIELSSEYKKRFAEFLLNNGITRVTSDDLLVMGANNSELNGACTGMNHPPPDYLWKEILPVAKALQIFRGIVTEEVWVSSAYRSVKYNSCISGSTRSAHLTFEAIDLNSPDLSAKELARRWRNLRNDGLFSGGIGVYPGFIHVDARGRNIDWENSTID